ncbi:MAG TPA: hypothetical protein VGU45_10835 [Microvirga sp.]|nr:hypothetical protein [Microvirga sp.]
MTLHNLDRFSSLDPLRCEAWQIFKLTPAGIIVELGIRSTDERSFPAGLGWHPYLSWSENDRLQYDANGWWPHEKDFFPTGERVALSGFDPLRTEETAYLDDWKTVEIVRSDELSLRLTAGGCLSHLVVHKPQGAGYICVEPVSHVTDAFNAWSDRERAGVRVLEPGQSLTGWVAIAIHDGKPREPERSH